MKYKFLSLIVLSALVSLVISLPKTGLAQEVTCFNFGGASSPLVSASINEGQLDFANNTLLSQYRACVQSQEVYGQSEYVLKGWVWNTNLGWVSLGSFGNQNAASFNGLVEYNSGVSPAGAKNNRGVASGDIAFSSVARVTSRDENGVNGELFGYWWGDNIGWIRLNCAAYYNTDSNYCANSNHKVVFNSGAKTPSENYRLSGYAWSNSVGWINMNGVEVNLDDATLSLGNIKMEVRSVTENVKADGVQGHRLQLVFLDSANTNITEEFYGFINQVNSDADNSNNISVCLLFNDNRKLDKVNPDANNTVLGQMSRCGEQAFTRFGSNINDFSIVAGQNAKFSLNQNSLVSTQVLKSTVPTDAGDFEVDRVLVRVGATDLLNELANPLSLEYEVPFDVNLVLNGNELTAQECESSVLESFRLSLGIPVSMNLCGTFGPVVGASNPRVSLQFSRSVPPLDLYFDKVTDADGDVVVTDYVEGTDKLAAKGAEVVLAPVNPKAWAEAPAAPKKPVVENNNDPVALNNALPKPGALGAEDEAQPLRNELTGSVLPAESVIEELGDNPVFNFSNAAPFFKSNPFRAVVNLDLEANPDEDVNRLNQEILDLGVRTTLEYTIGVAGRVRRTGPSLEQAFFRVDKVGGTGSLTDRAFTQVGSSGASTGSETRASIRDNFIKGVFESVAGGVKSACSSNLNAVNRITPNFIANNCATNDKSNIYYLANQTNQRWVVRYENIKSFFDNMSDGPRTVVLVGMDVYFDANMLESATQYPSLVLLSNKAGKGGNVYIGSRVTELKGYIFADKSYYSVEDFNATRDQVVDSKGVPLNYMARNFDKFYSPITFIGRFFGQNCFGCATANPPLKGDGTKATSFDEAQPYDFSYFRFSSLIVKTRTVDFFGEPVQVYVDCNGNSGNLVDPSFLDETYLCWFPKQSLIDSNLIFAAPYWETLKARSPIQRDLKAVNFVYRPNRTIPLFSGL